MWESYVCFKVEDNVPNMQVNSFSFDIIKKKVFFFGGGGVIGRKNIFFDIAFMKNIDLQLNHS